jgi:hypothetical protein
MANDEVSFLALALNGRLEPPYLYIHTVPLYSTTLSVELF